MPPKESGGRPESPTVALRLPDLDGRVVPVDVKSEKDDKKHKALDHLLNSAKFHVSQAVVRPLNILEQDGNILYCPIYMAPLLKNSALPDTKIDIRIFS